MSLHYLSKSQLAQVCEVDRRTVDERVAGMTDIIVRGKTVYYKGSIAVDLIRPRLPASTDESVAHQIDKVTLEVEKERLEKLKIENGKSRGELVSIDEVAKETGKQYGFVRAQLRSIPSKLAKPLSMVSDPKEMYARLQEAVDECLTELTTDTKYEQFLQQLELASNQSEFLSEPELEADADTQSGGVGGHISVPEPGVE